MRFTPLHSIGEINFGMPVADARERLDQNPSITSWFYVHEDGGRVVALELSARDLKSIQGEGWEVSPVSGLAAASALMDINGGAERTGMGSLHFAALGLYSMTPYNNAAHTYVFHGPDWSDGEPVRKIDETGLREIFED